MCRNRRTYFPAHFYDEILGQKVTEVEEVFWGTYGVCALHDSNIFRKDSLYREIQHINNAYTVQWLRKPQRTRQPRDFCDRRFGSPLNSPTSLAILQKSRFANPILGIRRRCSWPNDVEQDTRLILLGKHP